jgi:hypothetical protein
LPILICRMGFHLCSDTHRYSSSLGIWDSIVPCSSGCKFLIGPRSPTSSGVERAQEVPQLQSPQPCTDAQVRFSQRTLAAELLCISTSDGSNASFWLWRNC